MAGSKNNSHESFERKEKIELGSDKKFGYTFSLIFFALSISPLLLNFRLRIIFIVLGLIFMGAALIEPSKLHTLNVLWAKFGLLLNKIVSPLILGVLFFSAFVPVGFLLKVLKKDILNKEINKRVQTYWIDSTTVPTTSMKDQF